MSAAPPQFNGMPDKNPTETPRELLDQLVKMVVARRHQTVYQAVQIRPDDKKSVREDKARLLFMLLDKWSKDPLEFVKDLGWVSDPRGEFGSRAIPRGHSPRQMTPFIPFPKQEEMCRIWQECLDAPGRMDFAGAKSRQVAMSWLMDLLAIWAWLFRGDTHGVLTTYKREYIDAGGKGQRSPVSIFGRLRLALDALHGVVHRRFLAIQADPQIFDRSAHRPLHHQPHQLHRRTARFPFLRFQQIQPRNSG